jgi:hypothetical protein
MKPENLTVNRKMKAITKYILLSIIPLMMMGVMIVSCSDESVGDPVIYYIRNTNPAKSDSLYSGANLGGLVAIVGDNLGGTKQIFFNDQEAVINTTYITNKSILVNVPSDAPQVRTDKLTLIFRNGKKLEYNFEVTISEPIVAAMENEWAREGETAVIRGNYFFEPLTVKFSDGTAITTSSISQTEIKFEVPAGAPAGPITVTTNFGATESVFHFHDDRNIILNYDDLVPSGSWRYGLFVEDENSLDGKYVKFKGVYNAGERNEGSDGASTFESQFWAMKSGRPAGNFLPGDPADYSMKFETNVVTWDKSYLNICMAPYGFEGSGGSNQEIWSNSLNARAIWGPWSVKGAPFTTDGKWMTVVIPMTEFKWAMDFQDGNVVYNEKKFDKNATGSMSLWVLSAPGASNSPFEFYIDNVRIVPNK